MAGVEDVVLVGRRVKGALLPSIKGYRRGWLVPDLLAALTLLVIAVPEQLATSRLAGMPPVTGFYAFVAGTALFALIGSNPQMSVGADSTIAPLFAVGISHFAASGTSGYVDLVGILAVSVGVLVALVGILRLGWIAEFLSAPIITGFLAGVAVIIVVHQLPDLFGTPAASGSTVHRIGFVVRHLGDTSGWALGIGLFVLTIIFVSERVDRRIPGALVGLVGSTVLVGLAGLHRHGVDVLGTFAHGAPRLGLVGLSWSALGKVFPLAGVVALVVISQSAATTRAFADQSGYDVDVDRDFIGVGAGSIVAGLSGSFPVNASPARTAAVALSGGRTQITGLAAAVALVLLVPAGSLLEDLPLATLAAVLVFVASRIFHLRELRAIAHFDLFELALALVTLLTVALVGVEQGIGVAVGLAILDRTRRSARPQLHVLGRIPETTSWAPLSSAEHPQQVPGILVVLFATPLWYANSIHFRAQLESAFSRAEGDTKAVVIDALGMSDVDYTGCRALQEAFCEIHKRGMAFAMARAGGRVQKALQKSGLFEQIGADRFYGSVGEAVDAIEAQTESSAGSSPPGVRRQ